jgi:hypothetical protein
MICRECQFYSGVPVAGGCYAGPPNMPESQRPTVHGDDKACGLFKEKGE